MTTYKTDIIYRGYTIRKSGPNFFKAFSPSGQMTSSRYSSVEGAKAVIDATIEKRVMTPAEHALVYANR